MKRKIHEEYVAELAVKNPGVEVVEEYVDAKTKILHRCLKHDIYWKSLPSNVLAGKGCSKCLSEKLKNKLVKSHDEYINEVAKISPHIVVLESYVDSHTPILHFCKTHGLEWKAYPNNILKGYGCRECGVDKIHNHKRDRHDDYVDELKIKNPTVEVVGRYDGLSTKILHRCLIHNVLWETQPANALMGKGCEKCHRERIGDSNRKSHEQYANEVKTANKDIVVVGNYVDMKTPILHKCLKHDIEWLAYPNNILKGCGCPKCGNDTVSIKLRKEHKIYVDELKIKNPQISVVGEYMNMRTPILHRCNVHNFEWETSPSSVLLGGGFPKCGGEKIADKLRKTHEQYEKELKSVNPSVVVLGDYIDAVTPILHKCLIDGNEWYVTPSNLLSGYGCPQCNESKGERIVRQWLESHNIKFEPQKRFSDCCDKRPLPFDFYLPDYNAVIEYNGLQHYTARDYFGGEKALAYTQRHDKMKEEYCKNNNIRFLCIPYFKNVDTELNNFLFI